MKTSDGYISDVPYTGGFYPYLSPAWLDHVALISGFAPPHRKEGFTWCDLGCGLGVTDVVLAATHPHGTFHGIDAAPAHIDHACTLAAAGGVTNVVFHVADFSSNFDLPPFDYIVMHGVYSWVSTAAQNALRKFIDRHLKPGGLVYLSYNALPGWAADVPFQHLLWALGRTSSGNSMQRFQAAMESVRKMSSAGVPALKASPAANGIDNRSKSLPLAYLTHEFMGSEWRPLWFSQVHEAMHSIGLAPAGSATLIENFDSFVLGKAAREMLAEVEAKATRELVREFFLNQRFRRDVFVRRGTQLNENEQRRALFARSFSLSCPPDAIQYCTTTVAGQVGFDNLASRAIVRALGAGQKSLRGIDSNEGIASGDLLANALVLCGAGAVRPVESSRVPVTQLNQALWNHLDGPEPIDLVALPCGTALRLDHNLLVGLRNNATGADKKSEAWREFLAANDVSF